MCRADSYGGGRVPPAPPRVALGSHYGEFAWAFVLAEKGERNSRLIVRTRASWGPRLYRTLTMPFVLVGGEFFTTRKMLYGIKRRVEQATSRTIA
jgi:hypothetical protein